MCGKVPAIFITCRSGYTNKKEVTPMKRLFLFILLIVAIYFAKPLWEEPVSKYVDISFLKPVDEKIETFLTSESVSNRRSLYWRNCG